MRLVTSASLHFKRRNNDMTDRTLMITLAVGGLIMTFLAGFGFASGPNFLIQSCLLSLCGLGAIGTSIKAMLTVNNHNVVGHKKKFSREE